jgi:hypothetical protein
MGWFDSLRERLDPPRERGRPRYEGEVARERGRPRSEDEVALERYRYMLRTAPPDQIEGAHEEAFARLTPEQRQLLLRELSSQVPPEERARSDDPRAMARMATRAEMRQPGTIERALGGVPAGGMGFGGMGFGGMLGGTLLGGLIGSFLGTAMAEQFFGDHGYGDQGFDGGSDAAGQDNEMVDQEVGAADDYGAAEDPGGDDFGDGDAGGDMI